MPPLRSRWSPTGILHGARSGRSSFYRDEFCDLVNELLSTALKLLWRFYVPGHTISSNGEGRDGIAELPVFHRQSFIGGAI